MSERIVTNWETEYGSETHYVQVSANRVLLGSHSGSGASDSAGSITHQAFLEGTYQSNIQSLFGSAVLAQVIESVKNAPEYPPFKKEIEIERCRKEFLEGIPENPDLMQLLKSPDTQSGSKIRDNVGRYKSKLKSENTILTIEKDTGMIDCLEEGKSYPVKIHGYCHSLIQLKDHYYYADHNNDFAEIGSKGEIIFDTSNLQNSVFGSGFRLLNVFEHEGTIVLYYAWDSFIGLQVGLLEYQSGKGFTGHCEKSNEKKEMKKPESDALSANKTSLIAERDIGHSEKAPKTGVSKLCSLVSSLFGFKPKT